MHSNGFVRRVVGNSPLARVRMINIGDDGAGARTRGTDGVAAAVDGVECIQTAEVAYGFKFRVTERGCFGARF